MTPSFSIDTIGAWWFRIWKLPPTPGSDTDVTVPENNLASGDTISNVRICGVQCSVFCVQSESEH